MLAIYISFMGPTAPGTSLRFRVLIDGQVPGASHGTDIDDQGNGMVTEQRLYQLIRQSRPSLIGSSRLSFLTPVWRPFRLHSADPPAWYSSHHRTWAAFANIIK